MLTPSAKEETTPFTADTTQAFRMPSGTPASVTVSCFGASGIACPTNMPTCSASRIHGSAACGSPPDGNGRLTAAMNGEPFRASASISTVSTATRSCASTVDAPRCGVQSTFGCFMRAKSFGGSTAKTSRAAPDRWPESSAATSAASSTSGPRAQFTRIAPFFIAANCGSAEEVPGLGAARRVERHDVGLREQLVQRHRRHPQLGSALRRHERVEREQRDVPRAQARGHARADLAEADQPHGLALELRADELRALPFPGLQRSLCLGDLAQEREEDRDRVLRRGDDVPGRSVDDEDAALGGGLDVHVVEADARAPDHAQLLPRGEELAVHLRRGPHDEGVIVPDRREESLAGQVRADVRGEARLLQDREARLGEGLRDQDAIRRHPALAGFASIAAMASSWAFR